MGRRSEANAPGGIVKKPKRTTLRNKADKLFSLLIRSRDGRCVRCSRTDGLQCAHIVGRRYFAVRWDEANAVALCMGCHKTFTHDPLGWIDFIGEERFFELKRRAQQVHPQPDYVALVASLEARLQEVAA